MIVGTIKEIKPGEYRVGLVPSAVREYVARSHTVLVESGAGEGIAASDEDYRRAGATIVQDAAEVFRGADLILKVKEPQLNEIAQLKQDQILFTYLHLAPDPVQTDALLLSGCSAIAYETVSDEDGGLPLLAPMSEVAGRLSIEAAGSALRKQAGGRGLLLGGVPGVTAAKIVVIGGGVVGTHAARIAAGCGAAVTVLDRSLPRLREIDAMFEGRVATRYSTTTALEEEAISADAVIGAVLVPGARAPKLISKEMLKRMKPGAVLVDVAIDQGGCFETSRPTTHDDPTYEVDGVIHYCVANMPGAVPLTSSYALNNATLPFGLVLADNGLKALRADIHLRAGLNIYRGSVTNAAVASSLNRPFSDPAFVFR